MGVACWLPLTTTHYEQWMVQMSMSCVLVAPNNSTVSSGTVGVVCWLPLTMHCEQ